MTNTNKVKPVVGTFITDRRDSDIYGAGFEEGKRVNASALKAEQAKVLELVEALESVAAMSEEAGISRFARSAIAKYGE